MNRIQEKLVEPVKIYAGSFFKIKIKAKREVTYNELLQKNYEQVKTITYNNLKGESI